MAQGTNAHLETSELQILRIFAICINFGDVFASLQRKRNAVQSSCYKTRTYILYITVP